MSHSSTLIYSIGTLLKEFTVKECANYVRNSGYVST